jgi:hypothetical protein
VLFFDWRKRAMKFSIGFFAALVLGVLWGPLSPVLAIYLSLLAGGQIVEWVLNWEEGEYGSEEEEEGWGGKFGAVVRKFGAALRLLLFSILYVACWVFTTFTLAKQLQEPTEFLWFCLAFVTLGWLAFCYRGWRILSWRLCRLLLYMSIGSVMLVWLGELGTQWFGLNQNPTILLKGVLVMGVLGLVELGLRWLVGMLGRSAEREWARQGESQREREIVSQPIVMPPPRQGARGGYQGHEDQGQGYNYKPSHPASARPKSEPHSPNTDYSGYNGYRGRQEEESFGSRVSPQGHPMLIEYAESGEMIVCTVPGSNAVVRGRVRDNDESRRVVIVSVTHVDGQPVQQHTNWRIPYGTPYDNPLNR